MPPNDGFRFTSSPSAKVPRPPKHRHVDLPFLFAKTRNSFAQLINSLRTRSPFPKFPPLPILCSASLSRSRGSPESADSESRNRNADRSQFVGKSPLLCSALLSLARPDETTQSQQKGHSSSRHDEERVLISEVLVRNKDGEELERKDLEMEALAALKACRANSALTVREVQEDVHRIIDSGYFCSCMPVAVDTRDGIRLIFQVKPNQEFQGLVCEGANVLPAKFLKDAFCDGYGKVINLKHLNEVISSINDWYMDRGLFAMVSAVEILSGGILKLQVSETEVNNISIRFLDRKTGEPTIGKTKPETILRQLTTKKGQVYSMLQGKRDVETVLTMGLMEDVSIIPQPADAGKVDITMNVVERPSGGFSAGGGISSGITSGPLSGLIGSFAYSHRNLFGRNQKLHVSLERGQIDSIFRINYSDPWIAGDDKRTSRTIMVQNSRTPGTLIHNQLDGSKLTIARITAGIEYSRPIRPKLSGTAGLIFQHAGAHDEKGNPIIKDFYGSPLTASGNTHDDVLLAKLESVYTGSGDRGSSMCVFNMEQGLPVLPEWLYFNRINARARKDVELGPTRVLASLSGGHVVGNFPPHEAFAIGGTNSVRGYEEGAVGSGRSYAVGSGEISFPMVCSANSLSALTTSDTVCNCHNTTPPPPNYSCKFVHLKRELIP
ncbi:outer envelope protein 80 [Pyrus ussuriensis x Pyrus communis]|uniref:Outer envelope protein 80 n=1 Tax=Pyrus ussuriensis x Pyrus communis TaxID=2448454 RepID=A0A5N5FW09_9ROSA|nr:outer envelope protein 80 [Pyrus ussuriensis x Pyrus communis]